MSYVATTLSAISGIVTGIGQMKSAKQETKIGDYNATIYNQRAEVERRSNELLEYQKMKQTRATTGTQVALYANGGIRFSGTPIDVITDSLSNAYLDIAIDKYNSEVTARGYENEAKMQKYQAAQRQRVGYANAASTFLSTAATYGQAMLGNKTEPLGETTSDKAYTKVVWS